MQKPIILSIIIPVYNVEKYLGACLDSIVMHIDECIKSKIELILVNDGSKDNSKSICLDYVNRFEYIKYIYQENKGLSGARNTGIRAAIGKYVLFIDSDDVINGTLLKDLIEYSNNNYDIVFLKAMKWYADEGRFSDFGENYIESDIVNKPKSEVVYNLTKFRKFPGTAWNKMIKRDFLLDNHLLFEEGICSEDLEWSIRLFNVAETFGHIKETYYYYRQGRPDSITGTLSNKNINALIYILNKYSNFNFHSSIKTSQFTFLSYEYMVLLYLVGKLKCNSSLDIDKVYKLKIVLWKSHKVIYKISYLLVSIFGVRFFANVLARCKG